MNGADMRDRRKALKLTQAELAERLGLHRNHVGLMERGDASIEPRTAAAMLALRPAPLDRKPGLRDPLERVIEQALIDAGIAYETDDGGGTESRLDFHLPAFDVSIEVKRFYTPRTGEQMARAPNVIAVQGERAVKFLAIAIRSGDFFYAMLERDEREPRYDMR